MLNEPDPQAQNDLREEWVSPQVAEYALGETTRAGFTGTGGDNFTYS